MAWAMAPGGLQQGSTEASRLWCPQSVWVSSGHGEAAALAATGPLSGLSRPQRGLGTTGDPRPEFELLAKPRREEEAETWKQKRSMALL